MSAVGGSAGRHVGFREIADGVHVLRYPVLDVNVTLVLGDHRAVLVDTLSSAQQATWLLAAVRGVTAAPLVVVNTHHHFDHCFGNATFAAAGASVIGHLATAALLRERAQRLPAEVATAWAVREPRLAAQAAGVVVHPPERTVATTARVDLGGRRVLLRHPGPAHTDGDLVVAVPDAGVLVAGDLVEEGADPQFDDADPLAWPEAVAAVLRLASPWAVLVPGHGAVVDRGFVEAQHDDLAELARLIREGHAAGVPADAVAAAAPFDTAMALTAVRRGYTTLSPA